MPGKIRAVQEFSPSRAVGFVFCLKDAVRSVLGESLKDPAHASGLAELDGQIDRLALMAFDVYVQCRERFYELRVKELKRQIPWAVSRLNRDAGEPESELVELKYKPSES